MKIGIFGGSFNPPHNMHKKIGLKLIEKGYLDKVIYVPTGDKYKKSNLVSAKDRYKMLKLMIQDEQDLFLSDYEIDTNIVYTYQTLSHFKRKYPEDEIYFICGSDNLLKFNTWKNYKYILETYKILVIKRNDDQIDEIVKNNKNIISANITYSNLSSTKIRNFIKLHKNKKLSPDIDEKIMNYIKKENLY